MQEIEEAARKRAEIEDASSLIEREFARVKAEYEARIASFEEEKRQALARQKIELVGTAEEKAKLHDERSREERIELVRRQMVRRMLNRDVAMGFQAWLERYQAKTYALERLRKCTTKLHSPGLTRGFEAWIVLADEQRALKVHPDAVALRAPIVHPRSLPPTPALRSRPSRHHLRGWSGRRA